MTSHAGAGSPPTALRVVTTTRFARVRHPAWPATPPRTRLTHTRPLGFARERQQGERRAGEPRPGRQGGARPRLRRALPRPPTGRLLQLLLPSRQPARRGGLNRAGLPAGLPPFRPGTARVRWAAAASLADSHRPQPGAQLLPRPPATAADAAGKRRPDPCPARHRGDR